MNATTFLPQVSWSTSLMASAKVQRLYRPWRQPAKSRGSPWAYTGPPYTPLQEMVKTTENKRSRRRFCPVKFALDYFQMTVIIMQMQRFDARLSLQRWWYTSERCLGVHLLHHKLAFLSKNIYYPDKKLLLVPKIDKIWKFDQPTVLVINQFNLLKCKNPDEIPKEGVVDC